MYHDFLRGMTGGFYTKLFQLIPSADPINKRKLAKAFPGCTYAYCEHTGELEHMDFIIDEELRSIRENH